MPLWIAVSASSASASACCRSIVGCSASGCFAPPLVQALPGRLQRLQQEGTDLRSQAPADFHGPVFVWIHMERPAGVMSGGLLRLGLGVHSPPAAHDALDMLGGAGTAHRE